MKTPVLLPWLSLVLATTTGAFAAKPAEVTVSSARLHLGDVVRGLDESVSAVDLGPAPAAGASRVVTRTEISCAFDAAHAKAPAAIPASVVVHRKARRLTPTEIDALVRVAASAKAMRSGVALAMVQAQHAADVPDGWARVELSLPRAPKKAGGFSTSAELDLIDHDDKVLARLAVPVVIAVSAEGATYDTPRGATVTLVVRRSSVEVRVPAVATLDADVGDPLPVQVRLSGRVLRARLVSRDEAVAVEGTP